MRHKSGSSDVTHPCPLHITSFHPRPSYPVFLCLISFPSLLFHHPSSLHISPLSLISASPYRLGLSRLLARPQNCTTPNLTNHRERSNSPSALLSCPLVWVRLQSQRGCCRPRTSLSSRPDHQRDASSMKPSLLSPVLGEGNPTCLCAAITLLEHYLC